MLESLYNGMESKVFWKGKTSQPNSHISRGPARRGSVSDIVHNVCWRPNKELREKNLGCSIGGRFSGIIVFADDVALLSNSSAELQQMLEITFDYVRHWHYKINSSKSAVIVTSKSKQSTRSAWVVNGLTIEEKVTHPHLGISKSGARHDPTDSIIGTGLRTFYALSGTGAYTGGLIPTLVSQLWKTFCIPRMLHGSSTTKFTKSMLLKLDRAQSHLFKQILGVPKSAADEIVYLLTNLLPVSVQIDLGRLLLLGQLIKLDHSRFEFRTFLDALKTHTPSILVLHETVRKYDLPDLHSLVSNPPLYSTWKRMINYKVILVVKHNTLQGIRSKSSLKFWINITLPSANFLYPKNAPSPPIRRALIVRAQLLTSTYLTQCRLFTLKKSPISTCPLCKTNDETVEHFVGVCSYLDHLRQDFISKVKECLVDYPICLNLYDDDDSQQFTPATLLPLHPCLPSEIHNSLLLLSLFFLHKIDASRSMTLQSS